MSNGPDQHDGAAVRIPPPLLFVIPSVLGIVLGRYIPFSFPFVGAGQLSTLAALLAFLGTLCTVSSFFQFWATGQSPEPRSSASKIIQSGIYRFSRNPIYLGMGLLQVGLGLDRNNPWIVVLVVVSLALVRSLAILPEEAYLEEKFGEEYRAYKGSVGRWLGWKSLG